MFEPARPLTIAIQPLNNVDPADLDYVFNEFVKLYPRVVLNKQLVLPQSCWYEARGRYRADSVIHFLSITAPKNFVIIAVTDKDISAAKAKIKDYGIMGLGYQPGNACVVSTFRLSRDSFLQQLFKVCIHELGHTQDLPHCNVKTCYIRDAKGHNPLNEEKDFCLKCKAILAKKELLF